MMNRRKLYNHTRLFVGGLPPNTQEGEIRELFSQFGEILELYIHQTKGFAKLRYATKDGPECAIEALANTEFKGKILRIRHALPPSAVAVSNIPDHVTNEMLEKAFSGFGEVERAVVYADEKGASTNKGIVEFTRKSLVPSVIKSCMEGMFMLGMDPMPCKVEPYVYVDTEGGMNEAGVFRSKEAFEAQQAVPHFADRAFDEVEYELALRWKKQTDNEDNRRKALENDIQKERAVLLIEIRQAMADARMKREAENNKLRLEQELIEQQQWQAQQQQWQMQQQQFQQQQMQQQQMQPQPIPPPLPTPFEPRPDQYGVPPERMANPGFEGFCPPMEHPDARGPPPNEFNPHLGPPQPLPYGPPGPPANDFGYMPPDRCNGGPPPFIQPPAPYAAGRPRDAPPADFTGRFAPFPRGPGGPPATWGPH